MGWAKYYEDNAEIMHERQLSMQSHRQVAENKIFCATVLLVADLTTEAKEEPIVSQQVAYSDRYLVCKDCGQKFLFSAKEQRYYSKVSWGDPKRCQCCRNYRNTRYLMCSSF